LCESDVQYKPFHNQLAKREFPTFVRLLLSRLLNGKRSTNHVVREGSYILRESRSMCQGRSASMASTVCALGSSVKR